MSLVGKIQSLFLDREKTQPIFPITKVKAVSDENGVGLNVLLDEMNTKADEIAPNGIVPITHGGTGATTEAVARKNLHVLFSTPLIASSNHTGFKIVGDSSQNRKIFVKVKMTHQDGYTCEAMFPINAQTGAPVVSRCQHIGTLGFSSFVYKTNGNTTSYSIKYNVPGIYAFGSLEVLTFINTKSGHDGEITLKLDAHMSFTEVTDGTSMEIEWMSPPMALGVEYRTTERWNGKPVYTVSWDFGALPNNTFKAVDTTIAPKRIIGCSISCLKENGHSYANSTSLSTYNAAVYGGYMQLQATTTGDLTSINAIYTVKYTKD